MEQLKYIHLPRCRRVLTPDDHIEYEVVVQAAVRSWRVWRRYSDFEALHKALLTQCPNLSKPPESLPPKTWPQMSWDLGILTLSNKMWTGLVNTTGSAEVDEAPIDETDRSKIDLRRQGLERYLRAILASPEPGWRESGPWQRFLEVPTVRHYGGGTPPGHIGGGSDGASVQSNGSMVDTGSQRSSLVVDTGGWNAQTWMDEYHQLTALNRDIRNLLVKREAGAARNDVSAVHQCTLHAKQFLADGFVRGTALDQALQALTATKALSPGESRRRQDTLETWREEANQLQRAVLNSGGSQSRGSQIGAEPRWSLSGSTAYTSKTPSQRRELLQGGQLSRASTARTSKRVFGNVGSKIPGSFPESTQSPPETEETRAHDNTQLVTLQKERMKTQDDQVRQFSQILQRQHQLGLTIGHELEIHNQLLGELNEDVDRTGNKLANTRKQLNRIQ
ncbi:hypothetical protein IWQ61_004691 [Dispira simplex]|nr:hypothetical protein IWQ61_004691 [Dispira simplex]